MAKIWTPWGSSFSVLIKIPGLRRAFALEVEPSIGLHQFLTLLLENTKFCQKRVCTRSALFNLVSCCKLVITKLLVLASSVFPFLQNVSLK